MQKKFIAIVAGGMSGEREVSLRSASGIMSWIDRDRFVPYIVRLDLDGSWWVVCERGDTPLDIRTWQVSVAGQDIRFDYAYITIHGAPGENGLLQGHLDLISIPYNTGGVLCEALTFNKYVCNRYLSTFAGVRVAPSIRLRRGVDTVSESDIVSSLGFPLFVKPNTGGSSVATSRVDQVSDLGEAINKAFGESDEVILERLITGIEITCGCVYYEGELRSLPITEVVSHNTFFDYDAKYNGQVEEITPARIPDDQRELIQRLTREIYRHVDARGIIRVDYIIEPDGLPTLLEVNTTPGMTPTSFIPQQVVAAGLTMQEVLTSVIEESGL